MREPLQAGEPLENVPSEKGYVLGLSVKDLLNTNEGKEATGGDR